ncbi:MAG TPA: tRNA (N(6)-L-threonylcarbamoyladenosine(37)-C(2))-methylthiotransferase MtaB [Ruminiclostridium sp.]|jgi:threonylcarbamoyladenosine tRNA methylthiotransferase MtaB|nr:tRNA (N(6)-L-threonylcarbamoyladenosine(37)-C(2))-methylthiotransferase MtaB [Clostridiaceae bacterium]HAA25936.1 tRNA (N(6)-L-threonylcarbamoyladenosine(37)-C(2))-methylthiotransferase MtaB [Ruminiclostridium sp.]
MKTVAFITLGCKVNIYETEGMKKIFEEGGYKVVPPESAADVYVINTCTVTQLSEKKSRQMIRRAKRTNPRAIIAAVGCYSQIAPDEVLAVDGVNLVIGNNHKGKILKLVEQAGLETKNVLVSERHELKNYEDLKVSRYTGHTRAFLKIQDGCDQFCSYCIIPIARGKIRSRSPDSIIDEAKTLADKGFCEIVLTGIHITSYGKDIKGATLLDVIHQINRIEGVKRIRLGSLEPLYMSAEIIKKMAQAEKLCPHFHLSFQSGCDETLKRMNRNYTTAEYEKIVESIRETFPDAAITTDIMTGFPGETQVEFEQTCNFVERIGFSQAHIFKFSARKGTKAAKMPNQIPLSEKERRSKILFEICEKSKEFYRAKYIGKNMDVLFEQKRGKLWEGLTVNYIPVQAEHDADLVGKIMNVRLEKSLNGVILGHII